MNTEKLKPIVKGMFKHMPGVKNLLKVRRGGTIKSRYCYAVWMRHLKYWSQFNRKVPQTVVELGPGDSLGISLAALLCGAEKIYAVDVIRYWDIARNLKVFDDLVQLFKHPIPIPDNREFPKINPVLNNYLFPKEYLSSSHLRTALTEGRIRAIRAELQDIDNPNNQFIRFANPEESKDIIPRESVDLVFSQAVLEYITDLGHCFQKMHDWLRIGGCISHCIDFSAHGITPSWNGHWTFTGLEWKLATGGRKVVINRLPYSAYIAAHQNSGFHILSERLVSGEHIGATRQLAKEFRSLGNQDLTTKVAYLLARK